MQCICLAGAGYISHIHAETLQAIPGARIASVVDPDRPTAQRLAAGWGSSTPPRVHGSVEDALAGGEVDVAHILVPPGIHRDAVLPFLETGEPVLMKGPLAVSSARCDDLLSAARASGATLAVNQNFVFHPASAKLRRLPAEGRYCIYNVLPHQLSVRQFGYWMPRAPGNILLEQAVHPLSQTATLAGPPR